MTVTRLAVAFGVVALGVLCWLAVAGSAGATEILVTAVVLVVLVGGGNWLGGRRSPTRPEAPPGGAPPGDAPPGSPPTGQARTPRP